MMKKHSRLLSCGLLAFCILFSSCSFPASPVNSAENEEEKIIPALIPYKEHSYELPTPPVLPSDKITTFQGDPSESCGKAALYFGIDENTIFYYDNIENETQIAAYNFKTGEKTYFGYFRHTGFVIFDREYAAMPRAHYRFDRYETPQGEQMWGMVGVDFSKKEVSFSPIDLQDKNWLWNASYAVLNDHEFAVALSFEEEKENALYTLYTRIYKYNINTGEYTFLFENQANGNIPDGSILSTIIDIMPYDGKPALLYCHQRRSTGSFGEVAFSPDSYELRIYEEGAPVQSIPLPQLLENMQGEEIQYSRCAGKTFFFESAAGRICACKVEEDGVRTLDLGLLADGDHKRYYDYTSQERTYSTVVLTTRYGQEPYDREQSPYMYLQCRDKLYLYDESNEKMYHIQWLEDTRNADALVCEFRSRDSDGNFFFVTSYIDYDSNKGVEYAYHYVTEDQILHYMSECSFENSVA